MRWRIVEKMRRVRWGMTRIRRWSEIVGIQVRSSCPCRDFSHVLGGFLHVLGGCLRFFRILFG